MLKFIINNNKGSLTIIGKYYILCVQSMYVHFIQDLDRSGNELKKKCSLQKSFFKVHNTIYIIQTKLKLLEINYWNAELETKFVS